MTNADHDAAPVGRKPARQPLSRAAILTAALDLVLREGFDALTMRGLAAALGVRAMTLYTYYRGRDELVAALLDELLGTIAVPPDDGAGWQEQLRRLARAHRAMLHRVPSAIPYLLAVPMTGPHAARFGERVLGVLHRAGFAGEVAVDSFFTLLALNYGFAGFETQRQQRSTPGEPQAERIRRSQIALAFLPEEEFPLTVALARPLARFATTDAQYAFALDALLAGIAPRGDAPHVRASERVAPATDAAPA